MSRPFSRFQLEKSIIIKNIFIIKSLTDFRKTVETGVDPHLSVVLSSNPQPFSCKYNVASWFALGKLGVLTPLCLIFVSGIYLTSLSTSAYINTAEDKHCLTYHIEVDLRYYICYSNIWEYRNGASIQLLSKSKAFQKPVLNKQCAIQFCLVMKIY